jgi:hypothetical protein
MPNRPRRSVAARTGGTRRSVAKKASADNATVI